MELIPELKDSKVFIKDIKKVKSVIEQLASDGKDKLQVITDFDRTFTRCYFNGETCPSSYGIIDDSILLPSSYRAKATALRNHYYSIEISDDISLDEKYQHMVDWWNQAHALLVEHHVMKHDIEEMVRQSKALLRDGCQKLCQVLHTHDIPLLVFSAGVGDVLEEVIKQQGCYYDNVHIVSNYMDFNNEGKLIGFKGDIIHVFNKNESVIHHSDYFDKIENRNNVILLGDSIGDLKMADGVENMNQCLKIGFLNDKVESKLEDYKNKFDIVLVNDETMDVANAIINKII
ncbi:cytosolic 5'-nucleotidase 3A-like [Saccoglossus kowalevskii]|uniref:5'-nucleotidase n=1 Tax=Saccoglossus kowalevskii TaxID=10224 RepID=A0ABM0MUU0_SACKO|nr:PREDICTED: cytosolic 5'-nucleotidase 3A-like [Saccoglossus kowalevskii]